MGDIFTRVGAQHIFKGSSEIVIAGEATHKEEALNLVIKNEPDLLLLDTSLPGGSLSLVQQIQAMKAETRVLALISGDDHQFLSQMLSYNLSGYIPKNSSTSVIIDAVQKVSTGKLVFMGEDRMGEGAKANKSNQSGTQLPSLSKREKEILHLISRGADNEEISSTLTVSPSTVKNHITNIRDKLQIRSSRKLVVWSMQHRVYLKTGVNSY